MISTSGLALRLCTNPVSGDRHLWTPRSGTSPSSIGESVRGWPVLALPVGVAANWWRAGDSVSDPTVSTSVDRVVPPEQLHAYVAPAIGNVHGVSLRSGIRCASASRRIRPVASRSGSGAASSLWRLTALSRRCAAVICKCRTWNTAWKSTAVVDGDAGRVSQLRSGPPAMRWPTATYVSLNASGGVPVEVNGVASSSTSVWPRVNGRMSRIAEIAAVLVDPDGRSSPAMIAQNTQGMSLRY